MPSTFPAAWLVLALPFLSALVIAHARPLRELNGRRHRITRTIGVVGLLASLAGLAGLLPAAWTTTVVLVGGGLAGFTCFWPARSADGGDDWRRPPPAPDHEPLPPGRPDLPIDWQEFDRLRSRWARRPRVGR
jgi:hypothetical protein